MKTEVARVEVKRTEKEIINDLGDFLDNKSDYVDGKFVKKTWWRRFLDFWNKEVF